jgi:hypothetical protein
MTNPTDTTAIGNIFPLFVGLGTADLITKGSGLTLQAMHTLCALLRFHNKRVQVLGLKT